MCYNRCVKRGKLCMEEKNTPTEAAAAENAAKAAEAAVGAQKSDERTAARNYHVSLRKDDGKWQVKFAKGVKAIKLFDTQAEAIAYAKKLAENQDGSITIHKKDAKMRKQRY